GGGGGGARGRGVGCWAGGGGGGGGGRGRGGGGGGGGGGRGGGGGEGAASRGNDQLACSSATKGRMWVDWHSARARARGVRRRIGCGDDGIQPGGGASADGAPAGEGTVQAWPGGVLRSATPRLEASGTPSTGRSCSSLRPTRRRERPTRRGRVAWGTGVGPARPAPPAARRGLLGG